MLKKSHIGVAVALLAIAAATGPRSPQFDIRWLSAAAAFAFLAWFPGRVTLALLGIAREFDHIGRMVMSCAWSLAIGPIVLNLAWRWTNEGRWIVVFCGSFWILIGLIAVRLGKHGEHEQEIRPPPPPFAARTGTRILLGVIALILLVGTVGNYWPDTYQSYPVPAVIHDYIKQHAVLFSLEQRPLPLGNPFFAPGAAEPTYYYHFFYLLPATVRDVSGNQLSIALAFGLSSFLVAIAFTGTAYLMAQRWCGGEGPAALVALLCGCVGGFDCVPLLALRRLVVTLDGWADIPMRVHNLLTQLIWTPQNMLGLLITLLGASLLSLRGWWRGWLIVGPVLCHALIGSSLWIASVALPGLALLAVELWRRWTAGMRVRPLLAGAVATAVLMLAVSLPLLRDYAEVSRRHGKGLTLDWGQHLWNAYFGRGAPPGPIANWLDFPWLLILEFGPLLIIPLLAPRAAWRAAWENTALRYFMLTSMLAFLAYPTIRSHFTYNDFGHRIIMIPMITGAFMAGFAVAAAPGRVRWFNPLGWRMAGGNSAPAKRVRALVLAACLLLGSPVSWWQAPLGALRRFSAYVPSLARLRTLSTHIAYEDREALKFLRKQTASDIVVQADTGPERLELAQLTNHQIGVMPLEQDTHVFQGPDATKQLDCLAAFERAVLSASTSSNQMHELLKNMGVTHVLVGEVERNRWKATATFDDPDYFRRVFESEPATVFLVR